MAQQLKSTAPPPQSSSSPPPPALAVAVSEASEGKAPFPFDVVVVTSPDADEHASTNLSGPISSLVRTLPKDVLLLSTSDPFGTRMGSGGGTIAALDCADAAWSSREGDGGVDPTVLIVHAGGESSRCPTQMCLGKAWTSLPVVLPPPLEKPQTKKEDEEAQIMPPTVHVDNPTSNLIRTLSGTFGRIPRGSVVVAASDVLLNLPASNNVNFGDEEGVVGLAVPSPLETAMNHGVFVLDHAYHGNSEGSDAESGRNINVIQFLQKPTPEEMIRIPGCVTEDNKAWVDTGAVAFLPSTAKSLRKLARGGLRCCTARGLQKMHEESSSDESLESFAKGTTMRVELYTHLMLCLSTTSTSSSPERKKDFLSAHDDLTPDALAAIYDALGGFDLRAVAIPDGTFVHLGTTRELVDFMLSASIDTDKIERGPTLRLARRCQTHISDVDVHFSSVVINSILQAPATTDTYNDDSSSAPDHPALSDQSIVGSGTVIEHASLTSKVGISIGNNCLISGVRGHSKGRIIVPNGICLQMLPLKQNSFANEHHQIDTAGSWGESNGTGKGALCDEGQYVYVCLGVDDAVKGLKTLFGLPVEEVLDRAGLTSDDVWDEDVPAEKRTLWNARLHPVMRAGTEIESCEKEEEELLFPLIWINSLLTGKSNLTASAVRSLERWKSSPRLSLSQVRQSADAKTELTYRRNLSSTLLPRARSSRLRDLRSILLDRKHEPCDMTFVLDNYIHGDVSCLEHATRTLDDVVKEAVYEGKYDVAGRALMVMGCLYFDAADALEETRAKEGLGTIAYEEEVPSEYEKGMCRDAIDALRSLSSSLGPDRITSADPWEGIFHARNLLLIGGVSRGGDGNCFPRPPLLRECAMLMETASAAVTELCVSGKCLLSSEPQRMA